MAAAAGSVSDLLGNSDGENKKKNAPPGSKVRVSAQNIHGSGANLAHENESKKKAALANSLLEKKRASLDIRHRYLLEKFGQYVDEKPSVLENSLLIGNKLDLVNDFFAEGGSKKVIFFWQKDDSVAQKPISTQPKQNSLVVSLGNKEIMTGSGGFFVRANTKAIGTSNIYQDISFGPLTGDILPSLTTLVKHVIMPALYAQENWGVLVRQKDGAVSNFMEVLDKFTTDLDVALVNLRDSVQLHRCNVDLDAFKKPSEYVNALHSPEIINSLEGTIM